MTKRETTQNLRELTNLLNVKELELLQKSTDMRYVVMRIKEIAARDNVDILEMYKFCVLGFLHHKTQVINEQTGSKTTG